jgi:hypothetical protein
VSPDERLTKVRLMGFTDTQAAFLVTVMLHAGVCVGRHYCTFAGLPYGRKMHDFFQTLLLRGYATERRCGLHNARLYHVHYKPLYRAIGEPNNRHRRPMALPRAIERLLLLDGVLAHRDRMWLATEAEKVAHFTLVHRALRHELPALTFRGDDSETVRYFPDKLPIGVDRDGRTTVFLYLATQNTPMDFRGFLERHAELLRRLPAWTIRLLVPRHMADASAIYRAAFREQLASPLRRAVVDELRWYFQMRRTPPTGPHERFDLAARGFRAPRFQALYRAWLERGDPVVEATISSTLADAVEHGTGQLETQVLPHRYGYLVSLVGTA